MWDLSAARTEVQDPLYDQKLSKLPETRNSRSQGQVPWISSSVFERRNQPCPPSHTETRKCLSDLKVCLERVWGLKHLRNTRDRLGWRNPSSAHPERPLEPYISLPAWPERFLAPQSTEPTLCVYASAWPSASGVGVRWREFSCATMVS